MRTGFRAIVTAMVLWLAALAGPVLGRSVFVLYDTSGSMELRRFLPAFGAAVLGSTLDGRAGRDRLFTMTFADYRNALAQVGAGDGIELTADNVRQLTDQFRKPAYRTETMTDLSLQRRVVESLNRRFSSTGEGTPYGSVEVMLDAIARETTEGEEAHLIIVSDGEFQAEPSSENVLASIRQHRDRIKADLRVTFLLILPAREQEARAAQKLLNTVTAQNIRASLLSVFNGDPTVGSYDVNSGERLWSALQDIIAQIAATDRTELGRYVSYGGNDVKIDTPFSASRIIAVATNPGGKPPQIVSTSFGAEPETVEVAMRGRDPEFPGLAFSGVTSQFRFTPGLPPGQHVLTFDAAVADNVFLLFDTNVTAEVDMVDRETGQSAPRNGQGQAVLELGRTYNIRTTLSDPGSLSKTDFSRLAPTSSFTVEITGAGGVQTLSLQRDDAAGLAAAPLEVSAPGSFSARAQVRIPGFVSPRSEPLNYIVVSRELALTLAADRPAEACNSCAPGQVLSSMVVGEAETDVATYEVAIDGEVPGALRVDLPAGEGLVRLLDASGAEIVPGTELPAVPGQPVAITVVRRPMGLAQLGTGSGSGAEFALVLSPAGGASGAPLEIRRSIRLEIPDPVIEVVNYSKGSPKDGALSVTDAELEAAAVRADLRVSGTFEPPGTTNMTIKPQQLGWFWSAQPTIDGDIVSVVPAAHPLQLFWLETAMWVVGRDLAVNVTYADAAGLQSQSTTVPVRAEIGWGAYLWSLALNLLILALILYLLWVFVAWLRVQRFPKESVIEMRFPNDEFVRKRALRGSWTINLKAFLVPFLGIPAERAEVAGLQLISAPGGARLVLPKASTPAWYVTGRGQTLAQIREYTPSMQQFFLRWGERLEQEEDREHTLTLVRDRRMSTQGR